MKASSYHNDGMWRVIKAKSDPILGVVIKTEALEIPLAGCLVHVTSEHFNPDGTFDRTTDMLFVRGICIKSQEDFAGIAFYTLAKA